MYVNASHNPLSDEENIKSFASLGLAIEALVPKQAI
jgi:hypothetical protein